ncbi:hypothetical protein [Micromonospora sp. S4605]|nr:hypothetical protein [Micromonospora sp. S4605]
MRLQESALVPAVKMLGWQLTILTSAARRKGGSGEQVGSGWVH